MPEQKIPEMTPAQEGNLRRALRSSDARNNALCVVLENPSASVEAQEEMVTELQMLCEFASADVDRLKREYGFQD